MLYYAAYCYPKSANPVVGLTPCCNAGKGELRMFETEGKCSAAMKNDLHWVQDRRRFLGEDRWEPTISNRTRVEMPVEHNYVIMTYELLDGNFVRWKTGVKPVRVEDEKRYIKQRALNRKRTPFHNQVNQ